MYGCWPVRAASIYDPAIIAAASILRRGGLVAFPTETVYGLGANALDPLALTRVFYAKRRPLNDPLIVHIAHLGQLKEVARDIPPLAAKLAEAFWPGPLTLVLPRHPSVSTLATAGKETVAVRIPSHPVARALLRAANVPIAAPSANRFSRPSPTTAAHVTHDLQDDIDAVLDGGATNVGIESTIVQVQGGVATILRPGGVSREAIEAEIGPVHYQAQVVVAEGTSSSSPGALLKHYAPKVPMIVVDGGREAAIDWLRTRIAEAKIAGQRVGLLLSKPDLNQLALDELPSASLGDSTSNEEAAKRLFTGLRELESAQVDLILGRMPAASGLGLGLRDRLFRAASGRVVVLTE